MTREELITSREYWIVDIQTKLYEALEMYRKEHGLNRTQLAAELGFSKGYISQILNGDFDHRISKLVELSLKIGMIPEMQFKPQKKPVAGPSRIKVAGSINRTALSLNEQKALARSSRGKDVSISARS